MGLHFVEIAVADAGVGKNLADGKVWQKGKRVRQVKRIGLSGSAAIGDTKLSISYGTVKVAEVLNTDTGLDVDKTKMYWLSTKFVSPRETPINVIVDDAPATSPIMLVLDIKEF